MIQSVLLPSKPYIEHTEGNSAEIVIEGLHPGYGVTIGNALRRVLISSLPGAAVTKVKIDGVHHEFSTIPGVLEDVLIILLNLKQLRFKVFSEGPEIFSFEVSGEQTVTAADIKTPSSVEIVNLNQHIATLTKKDAKLSVELTVERGVGYRSKEELESERIESGMIVLDAIFTPVRKISYKVENMRVGTETDYNKLIFLIETDGTISPEDAFQGGLNILLGQLEEIKAFRQKGKQAVEDEQETVTEQTEEEQEVSVEDIKLSRHTVNALLKSDIKTIKELAGRSESDLRMLDGIGDKAIEEINRELERFGLRNA